jgi:DNA modification methylase
MQYTLMHGDNREQLRHLADNSIDSIVCDPPYELGFMGKRWDSTGIAYDLTVWTECLRVLKPGGHLIAFGGTRTYHRMTVAIEDAGFEIRDCIMYLYGSGFPKGLDVAWQMHKKASVACGIMVVNDHAEENHAKQNPKHQMRFVRATYLSSPVYACAQCGQVLQPFMQEQSASELRQTWQKSEVSWTEQSCMERWGNTQTTKGQLQRCEVCTLSHGVFADGSQGWVHHGASFDNGAIPWQIANEDGSRPSYRPQSIEQLHNQLDAFLIECRAQKVRGYNVALKPAVEPAVLARKPLIGTVADNVTTWGVGAINIDGCRVEASVDDYNHTGNENYTGDRRIYSHYSQNGKQIAPHPSGRWPANVILDEYAAEALDEQSGVSKSGGHLRKNNAQHGVGDWGFKPYTTHGHTDSGGASRFFYTPKASKAEREAGLEGMEVQIAQSTGMSGDSMPLRQDGTERKTPMRANHHPTVKPIALMRYLVRLVTPKGGTVLDPFMGSGSTGCAAMCEGVDFVGIELSEEYLEIARRRIEYWQSQNPMGL